MLFEALMEWLRLQLDRVVKFKHPLIYGTIPNDGWRNKNELLVAFKLPATVARQLAEYASKLAATLPGTMWFDEKVLHSTIAVLRIPDELREVITLTELGELASSAVTNATNRWLTSHPDPLITSYTGLEADQLAIMAWPEESGLLFALRTAILDELQDLIWGTPGLGKIEIRGSWAEHITLVRFARVWETVYYRLHHDLKEALEQWQPTEPFPMWSVELSYCTSNDGAVRLEPIVTIGLPRPHEIPPIPSGMLRTLKEGW